MKSFIQKSTNRLTFEFFDIAETNSEKGSRASATASIFARKVAVTPVLLFVSPV